MAANGGKVKRKKKDITKISETKWNRRFHIEKKIKREKALKPAVAMATAEQLHHHRNAAERVMIRFEYVDFILLN